VIRLHGNHIAGHLGTPGDIGSAFYRSVTRPTAPKHQLTRQEYTNAALAFQGAIVFMGGVYSLRKQAPASWLNDYRNVVVALSQLDQNQEG
jgi:hypothetical protein